MQRAGFDPARLNQAHALLRGYVEDGVLPGAATYISRRGEEAAAWYLGYADSATERPVTAETLFPLASVTKPMTAALVLTLVEAGQIALDEPVCTVLPEMLHPATERITLRHMLTHTSGLPGFLAENAALRAEQQPLARFVEASLSTAPRFPPGTQ
ncbi:MAG TPA: serine hydrolase domain-containing protein, partial [Chloroflexota bacterium]|nr:serine hydrolase domain-containing protein [Chloroflexota bacterium]